MATLACFFLTEIAVLDMRVCLNMLIDLADCSFLFFKLSRSVVVREIFSLNIYLDKLLCLMKRNA